MPLLQERTEVMRGEVTFRAGLDLGLLVWRLAFRVAITLEVI